MELNYTERERETTLETRPVMSKKNIILTLAFSFMLPVIIIVLAFLKVQIWPGGKFTIFMYDMQAQFAPIYASLRYLGNSDNSVFYTFFGALGNNALPNYISYILDPMSWITVLFSLEYLPDVLYVITVIKFGLCGLGFGLFLIFGQKGGRHTLAIVLLSCCYALMSYNVMYSEAITWLNCIALLPIVLLGFEKIIDGRKGGLYTLALTLMLCFNYQIAYMSGIFCALYFIYRLSDIKENGIRVFIRFLVCSLISLGLFMPLFLPALLNFGAGRGAMDDRITTSLFYYPPWRPLKQFMACQYDTINSNGLPSVFCGTLTLVLVIIYFAKAKEKVYNKIVAICVITFFVLSFSFVPINRMWHGFNEPIAYPARYSFLCCFLLLLLANKGFDVLVENMVLPKDISKVVGTIIAAFVLGELYLNSSYIITSLNLDHTYKIRADYDAYLAQMEDVLDNIEDKEFYRIARDYTFTYNDGMLLGYNGIGFFSSNYIQQLMNALGRLGYSQNEHALRDVGGTPVTEGLFGAKYKISNKFYNNIEYDSIYRNNSFDLAKNDYALPVGFIASNRNNKADFKELSDEMEQGNPFAYQEFMLCELTGEKIDVFRNIDYRIESIENDNEGEEWNTDIRVDFVADSEESVWIYLQDRSFLNDSLIDKENNNVAEKNEVGEGGHEDKREKKGQADSGEFLVNGERIDPIMDQYSNFCYCIGSFEQGQDVTIEARSTIQFGKPFLVYFDRNEYVRAYDGLKEKPLNITFHGNGKLVGHVDNLENESILIMTLPYMDGYRIYLDGKRTEYGAYRDMLIALDVPKGTHDVTVYFVPPGLIQGSIIAAVALLIMVVYMKVSTSFCRVKMTCLL